MSHYYLNCPACTNGKLIPRTDDSTPTYHCVECNGFWLLEFDHEFTWVLKRFNPDSGAVATQPDASISDDWEGEPRRFGVREQQWNEVNAETSRLAADEILHMIRNGDYFVLLNENGQPTHTIKESNGGTGFKLTPIQSPDHPTGSG